MPVLDLSCIEAESFYFSYNYFVVMHKNLLWLYIFQPVYLPPIPPRMLNLSPLWLVQLEETLVVLKKQEQVGSGWPGREAGRGEACVQGGTCAPEDGAHYLRTRVNSSFCQNGELKHRL